MGEAHPTTAAPGKVAVDDLAVDLKEPGRDGSDGGCGGDGEALFRAEGDGGGRTRQGNGAIALIGYGGLSSGLGRRLCWLGGCRGRSERGSVAPMAGGGRTAAEARRAAGAPRRCSVGCPRRSAGPRSRSRGLEVAAVHLVDEPAVRPELPDVKPLHAHTVSVQCHNVMLPAGRHSAPRIIPRPVSRF